MKITSYDANKRFSMFSNIFTGDELRKITNNDIRLALLMVHGIHLSQGEITVGVGGPSSMGSAGAINSSAPAGVQHVAVSYTDAGPLWIVDGAYVSEEVVMNITPDIVDFIEVLKGPDAAFFGSRGANGAIIINTKFDLNISRDYHNVGILRYTPKSYHQVAEFSMSDYDDKGIKEADFKDSRSTLYWNGHLYTNDKGKAAVSFFTADAASTYTITVSGITVNGEVIYKKSAFKTK